MQGGRLWRSQRVDGALRRRIRELVFAAYEKAEEPYCCDPRDLAEGLGLSPCPTRCTATYVAKGTLHYPDHLTSAQRGPGIYRAIASSLYNDLPRQDFVSELILPEDVAKHSFFEELSGLQPYVPLLVVQDIFMSHRASGVVAIQPAR